MNSIGCVGPNCQAISNVSNVKNATPAFHGGFDADVEDIVDFKETKRPEPPKISRLRLALGILKDEQVKQINEAGRLPDNAKFIADGMGGYRICNNFFGLRVGTQKIPAGFEVRKDVFGFAGVLPEDTKGLMVKNK